MKKGIFLVLALFLFGISGRIVYKILPIVHSEESYRCLFPKTSFLKVLTEDPAPWMVVQLDRDFSLFKEKKICSEAIEKTYLRILQTEQKKNTFHYRIFNGKLYKYRVPGLSFSRQDHFLEKALKTLLLYAKIPDVDFLLCTLDGVAEPYVQKDFYLTEKTEDQAPILAVAKIEDEKEQPGTRYVVLIPDHYSLSDVWMKVSQEVLALNREIGWEHKIPKAMWRGGLSDIGQVQGAFLPEFRTFPRFKICQLSLVFPQWIDAGLNWTDCEEMQQALSQEGVLKSEASKREHLQYKYLPCLDGHMCTYPGYQWRLLAGSLCLKQQSNQVQWFYSALEPYMHYLPVQNDLSDLVEKILWAQQRDEEMKLISERAKQFALQSLLPEHAYFYLYLVLHRYASLQDIDRERFQRELKTDPNWKCIQYRKRAGFLRRFEKRGFGISI